MVVERRLSALRRVEEGAQGRIDATRDDRDRVRQLASENPKQPWVAERAWDPQRYERFTSRLASESGAEAIQGSTIDYQPIVFLSEGARVSHTVAFVTVALDGTQTEGSGFMISRDLFITNHHVIESVDQARGAIVEFNFELDQARRSVPSTRFRLEPDRCFVTRPEDDLDFTIVAIGARIDGSSELETIGYCPLSGANDKHALGMPLNIVQHPEGRPKVVVIRNNLLSGRTDRTLLYEADTDHGSSGSPVFNDSWDVVALHHYGEPYLATRDNSDGAEIPARCNEGIRISEIVRVLREVDNRLVRAALELVPQTSQPRRPVIEMGSEALTMTTSTTAAATVAKQDDEQTYRVTVPLEISVRVNAPTTSPRPGLSTATSRRKPQIVRAVAASSGEKVVLDTNYSSRVGYDEKFLDKFLVPMPEVDSDVAPLKSGAHSDEGLLLYEHFAVKMHKARRMAWFTATNVDGDAYIEINRKTGQPGSEGGEKWFPDPRIDAKYFIDQTFYSDWSTYFDRGHLTRRSDPTWGDDESAVRANADTFHFTNCTPQHFRFNESSEFWQGVERFVLEKGGIERKKRLCVLQGLVLLGEHARCDDILVPLKFWKIVAWVGADDVRKVAGFMVSQEKILDEERVGIMPASAKTPIQIDQWRATIPAIAQATGLNFDDIAKYDTFKQRSAVGEGFQKITNWDQIVL